MQKSNKTIIPRSISPEGGATTEEFTQEILARINPNKIGNDMGFDPQQVALTAFENGKARLAAGRNRNSDTSHSTGNVTIESPMPGYKEIDAQVSPEDIQVLEQPNTDQNTPERSPELVG